MRKWPYLRMIFLWNNMFVLKKWRIFAVFCRLWAVCGAFFVGGTGWCLAFCGAVRCSICANGKFSGFVDVYNIYNFVSGHNCLKNIFISSWIFRFLVCFFVWFARFVVRARCNFVWYKSCLFFCLRRPPGDPYFASYQRRIMYIMYSLVCCGAGVCGMVACKMLCLLCEFLGLGCLNKRNV